MDTKQKTKKELIQILQEHNHPNSIHLNKFSKSQLIQMVKDSCLKTSSLPAILLRDDIENEDEVIQNICQILLPKNGK